MKRTSHANSTNREKKKRRGISLNSINTYKKQNVECLKYVSDEVDAVAFGIV